MRICAFREYDAIATGLLLGERVVALDDLNDRMGTDFGPDLDALLRRGHAESLAKGLAGLPSTRGGWKPDRLRYAPPLARPRKIWGVGLNFEQHSTDLGASVDGEPMAWMRPATTLAGHGATITLPEGVGNITAEAEIGIVMGGNARALRTREEAREAVFGFAPVLDLTALDLLKRNARNLTRAKSYDGFCVVGPFVVTKDEWEPKAETRIVTRVGDESREGSVAQMRHDPYELVRFFSHVFPWEAGDILLTGTPGALPLVPGATMRAEIDGLGELEARVA